MPPRVRTVLTAAGGFAAVLGLAVMAGWYFGSERITAVVPGLDPMAFNSALTFALLGLSLLAAAGGWPRAASGAAIAVIAYGVVTLAQHATDLPHLFDVFLLSPPLASATGRGSPNIGLSFLLIGSAIPLLVLGERFLTRLSGAMLGASALILALVDLGAQLLTVLGPQDHTLLPQMAVHGAFGVVVGGGALVYAGWYLPRGIHDRPLARLGFWAACGVFIASVFLAQLLRSHERSQIRGMVQIAAHGVAGQLQHTLRDQTLAAEAIAAPLLAESSPSVRQRIAAVWLGPSGEGIGWISPGAPSRWLALRPTGQASPGDPWWPDSALIARAAGGGGTASAIRVAGGYASLGLLLPDTSRRARREMVWTVTDLRHALDEITSSVTGRFAIVVRTDETVLVERGAPDARAQRLWGTTASLTFDRTRFDVVVWPTPGALRAARSVLPVLTLASGTLMGILLGLSLSLFRLARERTLGLQRANDRLTREISEREAVQAELRQREEELRQAQKLEAVGRLTGGIAHDYNNILTVIRSNARSLLLKESATDLTRDALEHIDRAAARGSLLTARLLAFSQRQLLQPETLSLGDLVASLREELGHLLGPNVALLFERAPGVDLVSLDRRWITQVILDLALNGREAMPLGGTLWLRTRVADTALRSFYGVTQVPGPAMVLEIEDSGRGMDEATRERLFEPFFSTKRFGQGSGLALASAYGIVRQSGGEIAVRSETERGTRVAIFLPLVDGPAPEPADTNLEGLTVLVAEDEPGILRFIRRTLEHSGCRVIEGANAEAALAALAASEAEPDLLVSDIVMPGLSGVELAEELRRDRPGLAVLFVSAYTSDALKQRGIESLAAFLLQKPFTAPELLEQVNRTLKASATRLK